MHVIRGQDGGMELKRGRSQRKSEKWSKSWRGERRLKLEAEQSGERGTDDRNEREHKRTATELRERARSKIMEYDGGREQLVQ